MAARIWYTSLVMDDAGRKGHTLRQFRRNDGQELIEYALVLPVLMLLLLGIMEFGMLILSYNTIANAAREGARFGVVDPSNTSGIQNAAKGLTTGLNQDALTVLVNDPPPAGNAIRVKVTYNHPLVTGPIIAAVGGGGTVQLSTVATMQIEQPYN